MKKRELTKQSTTFSGTFRKQAYSAGAVFIVIIGASLVILKFFNSPPTSDAKNAEVVLNQSVAVSTPKTGKLKNFNGPQFRDLYNSFAYPNTEYIAEDAVITGNEAVDAHIQKLAVLRGYARRNAPVSDVFKTPEKGMQLQERAYEPWNNLKNAAKIDRIDLFLTAAYRSAADQKLLFLDRLKETGIPTDGILSGAYDSQLSQILARTAIPGYSRHHTGYTIDIGCGNDPASIFDVTVCFNWLSKDNYKNAKAAGWIPSYPDGAGKQGPDPESWEYVWVGTDAVTE